MSGQIGPGQIGWIGLTVPDAERVRDFYQSATGWSPAPVDMGGYNDFCMTPAGAAEPAAGICHARAAMAEAKTRGSRRSGWYTSPWAIWMKASPAASRSAARFSGLRNAWASRPASV
jgi:hypothetical protein